MNIFIEKMDEYSSSLEYKPTKDQWKAIAINGCDILVSAAAGSGKTAVLSERISRKIALNKWDIDRVLVLTFTTAAAKNMLDRIEKKIEERLTFFNSKEDLEHLKKQRLLISNAKISTIDSFCLEILRKYYYLVEENINDKVYCLSPNFNILSNRDFILNESLNNVIEEFAKNNFEKTDILFKTFGTLNEIEQFIKNIYTKILSFPNYKEYINSKLTNSIKVITGDFEYKKLKNILVKINNKTIYNNLDCLLKELLNYKKYIETNVNVSEKIEKLLLSSDIQNELKNKLLDDLHYSNEDNFFTSNLELISYLDLLISDIKCYLKNNDNYYVINVYNNIEKLRKIIFSYDTLQTFEEILLELLIKLDNEFLYNKRKNNYLDFSDLNHLAIKALEKNINGKNYLTEAALYYQKLFLEIYVDEYQDNNDLQEYILNLIRGENTHFFRVGDVKQAIYGFRGSNPSLFENKYKTYTKLNDILDENNYDVNKDCNINSNSKGICVVLKENFRSKENVLKSSNFIFNRLMYKNNAGISYDSDSSLYYPTVKASSEVLIPTTLMLPKDKEKITSEILVTQIAYEINKRIVEENLKYSDFAILLRKANDMTKYRNIFKKYKIPIYYKEKTGFTDSHSFNILLNLLKFLDNPTIDMALLVILKSELFSYSNNDLIELSLNEGNTLYEKLSNSKLEKDRVTNNTLKKWFNYSYNKSPYEVVKLISWETNFLEYMRTFDFDEIEVDYFDNFLDIIAETSNNNINLSYTINKLLEIKKMGQYDTKRKSNVNSVTMSTIHLSKGLEYKNVFVLDLEKKFNEKDYTKNFIFSKELGLTINIDKLLNDNSFFDLQKIYDINSSLIKTKIIEEEIRILYVALTRAENKLYLATTTNLKLGENITENSLINDKEQIIGQFKEINSYADMLKLVLSYYDLEKNNENKDLTEKDAFLELYNFEDIEESEESKDVDISYYEDENTNISNIELEFLKYSNANKKTKFYPAKTSYSTIKNINEDFTENKKYVKEELLTLKTLNKIEDKITAMEKGNLIHSLFEKIVIDISNNVKIINLKEYIKSLEKTDDRIKNIREGRILKPKEVKFLLLDSEVKKINYFIDIIPNLLKNSKKIDTEVMFTNIRTVEELFLDNTVDEKVILQGVVDLLVIKENEIIIVDYKTDYVTKKDGKKELITRHKKQLDIYSKAVKDYYIKNKIVKRYIYSYTLGELIEV